MNGGNPDRLLVTNRSWIFYSTSQQSPKLGSSIERWMMAWEDFERNGETGMTGDKPTDEFALALRKIAEAYQSRFARKPTTVELEYALEQVIGADPEVYVSDPEGLDNIRVTMGRNSSSL